MKNNNIIKTALLTLSATALVGCDDFLGVLPDNRVELNTKEEVRKLLVSAYPSIDPIVLGELMSDNVDDMGRNNPYSDRFFDQVYAWEDITESSTGDTDELWSTCNMCVETANTALKAIQDQGMEKEWSALRGEALMCRAYANFILVSSFAPHYDPNDNTSLGITILEDLETTLNPKYERATVKECYASIQADIEEALPLVDDQLYSVVKYHFNEEASYAFATRFYLFTQQWEKAVECANVVLGASPRLKLRDWSAFSSLPDDEAVIARHYFDEKQPANLLLLASNSYAGLVFGPYGVCKRYSHNSYIGENETIDALAALWHGKADSYYYEIGQYKATSVNAWLKTILPCLFEYSDPVAGIGFYHTVHSAFTGDEVLLSRAEANILLGNYDAAAADMTTWVQNVSPKANTLKLTPATVKAFMDTIAYSYTPSDDDPLGVQSTIKKHLHPKFEIDVEGSVQESMLQLVLAMRRFETLHEGKRWWDIKRYGIEIPRRIMNSSNLPEEIVDWLKVDDPRRAWQFPASALSAGYTPNPR